jgi:N-glycosylase/DNA lyase
MLPIGVLSRYNRAASMLGTPAQLRPESEHAAWRELCFCLISPVTRFEAVKDCISRLERRGILDRLSSNPELVKVKEIERALSSRPGACRFPAQKARRLAAASAFFYGNPMRSGVLRFLEKFPDSLAAREALVKQVPGLGMKEASHFLRNTGRGNRVAVLDVHLRRFMVENGIVDSRVAASDSPASYSSMEREFTSLAFNSGLDPAALDQAIWEFMRER